MKVIVGLGNPGRRYQNTRHNAGFEVLAELARRHDAPKARVQFEAEVTEIAVGENQVLLVAPQTYMNASGRSVARCVRFYQLSLDDVLVVCDDLNLQVGQLRLRASGSAGGQKGLKSIIQSLGTDGFARLRVGIGRPPASFEATDYVLSRFRSAERGVIDEAVVRAGDGVETWVSGGMAEAMNRFNVFKTD